MVLRARLPEGLVATRLDRNRSERLAEAIVDRRREVVRNEDNDHYSNQDVGDADDGARRHGHTNREHADRRSSLVLGLRRAERPHVSSSR